MTDPIAAFKLMQRQGWASFAPLEWATTPTAARLVRFAGVKPGARVLDVGCGTGVVAITARRVGASVTGLDLTPELLSRAKEHGGVAGFEDVVWKEGDAEQLPFADGEFDCVLSQFGHMFAPRPDVAMREMLRVLKPGGTVAFSTWPPELGLGKVFALVGQHAGPLPPGIASPVQWGDVAVVRERLGSRVKDVTFEREIMRFPAMSVGHYRENVERTSGPVLKLVERLASDPARLAMFRRELEQILAPHFDGESNVMQLAYLMTRATKA